jgi:hypothetical protein
VSEVFIGTVDVVRYDRPDIVVAARLAPGSIDPGDILPTVRIIRLNADTGEVIIGGPGRPGTLRLVNGNNLETATLDATFSNLRLGGNGTDGDILLYAGSGDRNNTGAATIHLDGEAGDILLRNGDCAEDFEVASPESVAPGSVLALADDGRLHVACLPYDRRVAGIVSGAGDTRPGIVLARDPHRRNRLPVALVGRVNCWVDASYGPVSVGDLLTTSSTPGHAMLASDPSRSFGSVIGKAMRPLSSGSGLVPVLVALQ